MGHNDERDHAEEEANRAAVKRWEELCDERVQRTALILDQEMPGWALKIDENNISIEDERTCIIGQLEDQVCCAWELFSGKYADLMIANLPPRFEDYSDDEILMECGFLIDDDAPAEAQTLITLNNTWRREVIARKESVAQPV